MAEHYGDERVRDALVKLNDAICEWERASGCEATLILVPTNDYSRIPAEDRPPIEVSRNGKPVRLSPQEALRIALEERGEHGQV